MSPRDRRPIVCHVVSSATPYTDVTGDPARIRINLALQNSLDRLDDARFAYQPVPWKSFIGIAALTDPSPDRDGRYRNDLPIDLPHAADEARAAIARFR